MELFRLNQKNNYIEVGSIQEHGYVVEKKPVSSLDIRNGYIRLGNRVYYDGMKVCNSEVKYKKIQDTLLDEMYNAYKDGLYIKEKIHDL